MSVQSVERAFAILRAVGDSPANLSELARRVGLSTSTVARLLGTLEEVGAVSRRERSIYTVGPVVASLAGSVDPALSLVPLATTHLRLLAEEIGETTGLAEARDAEIEYVAQFDFGHDITIRDWTGTIVPGHVGSVGRAIMAFWPDELLNGVLSAPLERFTEATVTDLDKVIDSLADVRRNLVAWSEGEWVDEINSVASPIFDSDGRAIAALHAHGPSFRFPADAEHREFATRAVRDRAAMLSSLLGFSPTRHKDLNAPRT